MLDLDSAVRRGTSRSFPMPQVSVLVLLLCTALLTGCWAHRLVATGEARTAYVVSEHPIEGAVVLRCTASRQGVRCVEVKKERSPSNLALPPLAPLDVTSAGVLGVAGVPSRASAPTKGEGLQTADARRAEEREATQKQEESAEEERRQKRQERLAREREALEAENARSAAAVLPAVEEEKVANELAAQERVATERAERLRAARERSAREREEIALASKNFTGSAVVSVGSDRPTVRLNASWKGDRTRVAVVLENSRVSQGYALSLMNPADSTWIQVELLDIINTGRLQGVGWIDVEPWKIGSLSIRVLGKKRSSETAAIKLSME